MQARPIGTIEGTAAETPIKACGGLHAASVPEDFGTTWRREVGVTTPKQNAPGKGTGETQETKGLEEEHAPAGRIDRKADGLTGAKPTGWPKSGVSGEGAGEGRVDMFPDGSGIRSATRVEGSEKPKRSGEAAVSGYGTESSASQVDRAAAIQDEASGVVAVIQAGADSGPLAMANLSALQAAGSAVTEVRQSPDSVAGSAGKFVAANSPKAGGAVTALTAKDADATMESAARSAVNSAIAAVSASLSEGHESGRNEAAATNSMSLSAPAAVGVVAGPVGATHAASSSPIAGEAQTLAGGAEPVQGETLQIVASGPAQLDVGVFDGTHGWLRIHAELDPGGGVNASVAVGAPAHESMRAALPEMMSYLASEAVKVESIAVHKLAEGSNPLGGALSQGAQDGGAAGHRQNGAQTRDGTGAMSGEASFEDGKEVSSVVMDSGVSIAADGGGWAGDVSGAGLIRLPAQFGLNGSGGWLDVCA